MWQWECTLCGHISHGNNANEAEQNFIAHAREKHNPGAILSVNSTPQTDQEVQDAADGA